MTGTRPLTERQAERRRRVIRSALELAEGGGYDAVHMRDVAARADVALGTVYHYFVSKDHLLAAALVEWVVALERAVAAEPPRGSTDAERVRDLLGRITGAMADNDRLSAALVTGLLSDSPEVGRCQEEMHEVFSRLLASGFAAGVDAVTRDRTIRTIEHVWFSALIGWTKGWMPLERAIAELHDAVDLVLPTGTGARS